MIPVPTPAQAVHVLEILDQWTKRGWSHEATQLPNGKAHVCYTDPKNQSWKLHSDGVNFFDAICQATTVMQVLLEEHPEKAE